jgi:hypothetical protein
MKTIPLKQPLITTILAMGLCATPTWAKNDCTGEDAAKLTVVKKLYQRDDLPTIFLSTSLTKLIEQDNLCAETEGGICRLDFMPAYDSQDPDVTKINYSCHSGQVTARLFERSQKPHNITYAFVRQNGRWVINDVIYPGQRRLSTILTGE